MRVPPCQCANPGFCPRYRRPMEGRLFELCRTREDYRRLWDRQDLKAGEQVGPTATGADGHIPEEAPTPSGNARPDGPPCGVVIGSYNLPNLIELQIRLIRETCGQVPLLVSDDCSSGFGPRPEPGSKFERLQVLCTRYPDVTLWPNVERIGHTGGDLAGFWKGLIWARALGLRVLAKLSQRFLIDRLGWLQEGARDLLRSGLPLACRRCRGREVFALRTEACLLDVHPWSRPEVLARLVPRRFGIPHNGETLLHEVFQEHLGSLFWPWDIYGEDRYQPNAGIVWHCSDPPSAYQALANRFHLALDEDFHTGGWPRDESYLYG